MRNYDLDQKLRELEINYQHLTQVEKLAHGLKLLRDTTPEQARHLTPANMHAYRLALVQTGQTKLAGYQLEDLVRVDEFEPHWIQGPWEGYVTRMQLVHPCYPQLVRPLTYKQNWRNKPRKDTFKEGLWLRHPQDKVTLIEPHNPVTRP